MLSGHLGAVEADLFRYYNLDLRELLRAEEFKRIWRLVENLPAGCALYKSLFAEEAPWTEEGYLLANVIDTLQNANWQRMGKKANKSNQPKPFPRPDPKKKAKKEKLLQQLRNLDLLK